MFFCKKLYLSESKRYIQVVYTVPHVCNLKQATQVMVTCSTVHSFLISVTNKPPPNGRLNTRLHSLHTKTDFTVKKFKLEQQALKSDKNQELMMSRYSFLPSESVNTNQSDRFTFRPIRRRSVGLIAIHYKTFTWSPSIKQL